MRPDCLLGVVPQPTDSRLSETTLDDDIQQIVCCLIKTCELDPLRSKQIQLCLSSLVSVITAITNKSLDEGAIHTTWTIHSSQHIDYIQQKPQCLSLQRYPRGLGSQRRYYACVCASYLKDRKQTILIGQATSEHHTCNTVVGASTGIPVCPTNRDVIRRHGIQFHHNADDLQLMHMFALILHHYSKHTASSRLHSGDSG